MKSFIRTLLLFFVFSFLGYLLLIGLFGIFSLDRIDSNLIYTPFGGENDLRLLEADTISEGLDILFIGSSHSYRSFDSRSFERQGWETFNLGSSSQTHIQTNYLLKKYLDEMKPKLVVYEVYPNVFMSDGIESTINLLSSTPNLDYNLMGTVIKTKNVKAFNTAIFSIFLNLTNIKSNFHESISRNNEDKYISGGYVEREISFNEDIDSTKFWQPLDYQLKYFNKNLKLINESGIPYVLILTPYTYEFTNDNEIDTYLISKGNFYNFNSLVKFDNKFDFYDTHHLNQNGVKKLNKEFINIILRDSLLKN